MSFSDHIRNICFAVLGGLTARHLSHDPKIIATGALVAVALSVFGAGFISLLILMFNSAARSRGYSFIGKAVSTGFIMLIPFTILAAASELILGWRAVQVFASAGIMSAGAAIGVEQAKLGGAGLIGALAPSIGAVGLSITWMLLSTLAAVLGRS